MKLHPATQILYQGMADCAPIQDPEIPPIYPATAYILKDMDDYAFASKGGRYYYNRTANPNRDALGSAVSQLENGEQTLICSSGMAAISTTLLGLLSSGEHVLMNRAVYGETIELARDLLSDLGIQVSFADFTDLPATEKAIRPNTKLLYTEIISNPTTAVVDIEALTGLAHRHGLLTVVDSTFTTPFLIRPIDRGADLVIHSLTKYFGGHSDLTGGAVTASSALIKRLSKKYLLLGCCLDPGSAWMFLRSMKTMEMRVSRQNSNAAALAKMLDGQPEVRRVYHPSLPTHPQHQLAEKQLAGGYGAILSFLVEDDREKVNAFMHKLRLVRYLGTLGGIRTTYTHPLTAFRDEFTREDLADMGISEGLIRVSVGAEDFRDIAEDFRQALSVFSKRSHE